MGVNHLEQIIGSQIVEKVIPELWSGLKLKYKEHTFRKEEELKVIYQEYLSYSYEKYSQIKTLLYSNEPQSIYSFYEPMKLSINGNKVDLEDSMEAATRCVLQDLSTQYCKEKVHTFAPEIFL